MAIDSQSKEIDGVMYEVWRMPNLAAAKLLVRIGKFLGPAIGAIPKIDTEGQSLGNVEFSTDMLTSPISALLQALTEEQLESITYELLYKAKMGNTILTKSNINTELPNVLVLFKLLAFAFEVTYASFLEGLSLSNLTPLMNLVTEPKKQKSSVS